MDAESSAGSGEQQFLDASGLQMAPGDARTNLERQLEARERERLRLRTKATRWLVEERTPTWVDRTKPHLGAPPYLWDLLATEINPRIIDALVPYPDSMCEILVDMWRRWRTRWIRGEWDA